MLQKLSIIKILAFLVAALSLFAAFIGIIWQDIYSKVINTTNLPGTISQDVVTLIAALLIMGLLVRLTEAQVIRQIVILGLLGHIWYAYGIYVIEQVYTLLYLVYLAIFGLASYTIAYSVAHIRPALLPNLQVPKAIRFVAVGWSFFTPALFCPLWIGMLFPLMRSGQKPEFLYSVFILDLCFVMPAFVIVAVFTAQNKGLGLLLMPILFVKAFALLFSVALELIHK